MDRDALVREMGRALVELDPNPMSVRDLVEWGCDRYSDDRADCVALASRVLEAALAVAEAKLFPKAVLNGKPKGWSDEMWEGWKTGRRWRNKSGCVCVFADDDETVIELCAAHKAREAKIREEEREAVAQWHDEQALAWRRSLAKARENSAWNWQGNRYAMEAHEKSAAAIRAREPEGN